MLNRTILILLFISLCSSNNRSDVPQKNLVFEIDFQDFFNHDSVSLILNDDTVFYNLNLISDKSNGHTDTRVDVFSSGRGKMEIICDGKSSIVDSNESINLLVTINSVKRSYAASLSKGRYLGISKKYKNDLTIIQATTPFQYD